LPIYRIFCFVALFNHCNKQLHGFTDMLFLVCLNIILVQEINM
jgi:hypothetical protein